MKIYMLWGQRICSYEGEYAPELICAVDELTEMSNSEYLRGEKKRCEESKEFSFIAVAVANIPDELIERILRPENKVLMTGFQST